MLFQARSQTVRPLRVAAPAVLTVLSISGGCTSLDPKADIDRAASTVAERSGATAAWTEPWESSLTMWDGRSPLTVDLALAMALRNNREIRSQVEQIAASRADLVQAGLLPNPVVGLTLRFPFDPVSGGTFIGAQAVQSFTALWLRDGKIEAADARLNQTVLDISDEALRLVAEVKAMHARIAFGERALTLSDESLATIRKAIDSLDARVRGGEGTTLDVNRARQQLAKAEAERALVARDLAKERRGMLELIGFAAEGAEWTAATSGAMPSAPPIDESGAVALALSQRLDVAAVRAIAEAHRADLSVEEQSRVKDFGLGADFERAADGAKSVGPVLEVAVPIFDTNQAQIAKAGSLARAALANFEAASQRAVREARVAWVELDSALRLVDQYRSTVLTLSERNLALAEAALKAGQADVTVLLESQRELIDARARLNELERQAAIAHIELEYAVGGGLTSPLSPARDPLDRGPASNGAATPPSSLGEAPSGEHP
ncbi:MAG: RND transporter [Phycisphaerae bacterium]|nr:MAG: RND transporter [Phycisphaerae bacterium]